MAFHRLHSSRETLASVARGERIEYLRVHKCPLHPLTKPYETSRDLNSSLIGKIVCQHQGNKLQPASCKFQTMDYFNRSLLSDLRGRMSTLQIKANAIAYSDGASIWLMSLPPKSEGQNFSKRDFFDAIYLRYGWEPSRLSLDCVCSKKFSIDNALSCKVGGFIDMRHNDILNVTSDLLSIVCKDVEKEPTLDSSPAGTEELRGNVRNPQAT